MKKLLNNWTESKTGKPYEPTEKAHGIIYKITDLEAGKIYIGKKQIYKEVPMSKRDILKLGDDFDGRKKYTRKTDTNWKIYTSSCDALSSRIKLSKGDRNTIFVFNVLHECYDETALKFKELEEIILHYSFSSNLGYNEGIQIKQIGKIKNLSARFKSL